MESRQLVDEQFIGIEQRQPSTTRLGQKYSVILGTIGIPASRSHYDVIGTIRQNQAKTIVSKLAVTSLGLG